MENYKHAIEAFRSKNDYERLASALLFYGRELALCKDDGARSVLEQAAQIIKRHRLSHTQYSAVCLLKGIGGIELVSENLTSS